jgi:Rod binding domain-containing protein
MTITPSTPTSSVPAALQSTQTRDTAELRETFQQFVGETFFSQLIGSMRNTVGEPAYFHGGQAERTFQAQLDQQLAQELAAKSSAQFADPMFELFMMQRS